MSGLCQVQGSAPGGGGVQPASGGNCCSMSHPPPPLLQECGEKSTRDEFNEGESSAEIHWKGWGVGVGSISLYGWEVPLPECLAHITPPYPCPLGSLIPHYRWTLRSQILVSPTGSQAGEGQGQGGHWGAHSSPSLPAWWTVDGIHLPGGQALPHLKSGQVLLPCPPPSPCWAHKHRSQACACSTPAPLGPQAPTGSGLLPAPDAASGGSTLPTAHSCATQM